MIIIIIAHTILSDVWRCERCIYTIIIITIIAMMGDGWMNEWVCMRLALSRDGLAREHDRTIEPVRVVWLAAIAAATAPPLTA